ncbi:glutamyl-tRNA amidotransferase [Gorgonomyces haynaldii]|nr:glutamyl-tRNA amidotransferase [Gorgonomyces haynaldii]
MNFSSAKSRINALVSYKKDIKLSAYDGLKGALFAVKDNICTLEFETNCASNILKGYQSPFDATCVDRLKSQGSILVGKTNMDEFGMGSSNIHSIYGPVINPISSHEPRVAGGSSGGSAAAVAGGLCHFSLGSDTGGSVRLPASYCGVVGFKPSYGRISRFGLVTYANSLDCIGILSKAVQQTRQVYQAIQGKDDLDPTTIDLPTGPRLEKMNKIRIGVPQEYHVDGLSSQVLKAWSKTLDVFESLGAEIVPVSLPHTKDALSAYYVLAPAEAYSNLSKYDGIRYGTRAPTDANLYEDTRSLGFGKEVKRRLLVGSYVLQSQEISRYFVHAQKVRRLVQTDFDQVFRHQNPSHDNSFDGHVDAIVTPVSVTSAPTIQEAKNGSFNPYVNDVFTIPASLAGLPAISVPVIDPVRQNDTDDAIRGRQPIGIQICGQFGNDALVLDLAQSLEHALIQEETR